MISNMAMALLCNFCISLVLQNHFHCAKAVPSSLVSERCIPCNSGNKLQQSSPTGTDCTLL